MKVSDNCINLIKKYEGCKQQAYLCPAGVWTIGYGHTSGVKMGDLITLQQAEQYLRNDIIKFENKVRKYDSVYHWNQNQFDALVSFAFNIGSIDQLVDCGKRTIKEISNAILLYNKANGKVLSGLQKRRLEEKELFDMKENKINLIEGNGILTFLVSKQGNKNISENFKVKEFACKDGSDELLVDVDFVRLFLQNIRDHFNTSVIINSAYRNKNYNAKVGGAKNSYHTKGQAFDIVVKGHTPKEVAQYAQFLGIKGIIQYPNFVHIDSRQNKYWAVNFGKPKTVSGF